MKVFKSKDNLHHLQVQARNVLPILVTLSTSDLQSRANGWETHTKLPIIYAFPLVFNEIALNLIDSPLPLSSAEYIRLSDRFCGRNNIEMRRRGKRKQRCPRPKNLLYKHSVSTLLARDCRPRYDLRTPKERLLMPATTKTSVTLNVFRVCCLANQLPKSTTKKKSPLIFAHLLNF